MIDTVVDPRSIQMRIAYNFAELPDASKYMPRLVDDRVGYWDDAHISFDHVERMDNIVRYVTRWNMKASDPSKPISPAVHPIVYTLQSTIPMEYRDPIRRAILAWNAPFEKIGISGAVASAGPAQGRRLRRRRHPLQHDPLADRVEQRRLRRGADHLGSAHR